MSDFVSIGMRSYYVYQLRLSASDAPFYIGKGKGRRVAYHFTPSGLKARSLKNSIIKKAMSEGVEVLTEILVSDLTEIEALNKEVELIAFYGRRDIGTGILANHTDGGDGTSGHVKTPESIAKISAAKVGKRRSPETVEKMSIANTGKTMTRQAREKISRFQRGRTKTPEHLRAMKFGQWDKNPAWKMADVVYDEWVAKGKPGWTILQKSFDVKVRKLQEKFLTGWNPRSDSEWASYALPTSRIYCS